MSNPIIDFIHSLSSALGKHFDLAYRYCYEDPENSLVKLRAFATLLVDELYQHYSFELPSGNLLDKLNETKFSQRVPYHIRDKLNFLRTEGNWGAHPERNNRRARKKAQRRALIALQAAYKIAVWLHEEYARPRQAIPDYIAPSDSDSDKLYGDAIVRNQPDAQYAVAMWFKQQSANEEAYQDCAYWLHKAVRQQHPAALYQLAQLYLHGQGVNQDAERARALLQQAAQQHNADALYQLGCAALTGELSHGIAHPHNLEQAFTNFTQAAEQEHLGALNYLVQMYHEGIGVAVDADKAFTYAYKAAQAGYPSAQFKLAYLYQSGRGVEANEEKALAWYHKAALAGDADAQVVMFKYYSNGFMVEKNLVEALEWLYLAEVQNHPGACYYLGLAYRRGIGVKVDVVQAVNLFKKCLDYDTAQQYIDAQYAFVEGITLLRQHAIEAAKRHQRIDYSVLPQVKIGRNDPCPCGTGMKVKKCDGD